MSLKVRHRAPVWVFILHEIQQRIRSTNIRNKISKLICKFKKSNKTPALFSEALHRDGFMMIGNILSIDEMHSLIKQLKGANCTDRARKSLGEFKISDVPKDTHVADINNVVDIPEAIKLANNEYVLSLVKSYLGAEPIIDNIKAWWSLPGFDEAENEQFYHRDNDSIKFIKLFMYLTDVDEQSGPHVFIKGSQNSSLFEERRRFSDIEVENAFHETDKITYYGKAGTAFLEDTYGIHKGTLPTNKKRLLIQVRYSLLPTIFVNKFGTTNPESLSHMCNANINKYLKVKR